MGLLVSHVPYAWLMKQECFADRWRHRCVTGLATGIKCDLLTFVNFKQLIVNVLQYTVEIYLLSK